MTQVLFHGLNSMGETNTHSRAATRITHDIVSMYKVLEINNHPY